MAPLYLIDTDICIYIAKRNPAKAAERLSALEPGAVAMSIITYGELLFGANKSSAATRALAVIEELGKRMPVLELNRDVGVRYGEVRATLEAKGTPIGANDLWIAAHALAAGLILVTNNVQEFKRVKGLKIENWAS